MFKISCFKTIYKSTSFCLYHSLSSPESRPLSIPMKVMPDTTPVDSWTTSEERMKELIAHAWDAVKRLTVQVPGYIQAHKTTISFAWLTLVDCPSLYSWPSGGSLHSKNSDSELTSTEEVDVCMFSPVPAWVSSGYLGLPPESKDMHLGRLQTVNCP